MGREPYDDGALIVVCGRESRLPGEGGQVSGSKEKRGMRHADRRNLSDDPSGTRQTRTASKTCLSATVQPSTLPKSLWQALPERGCTHPRCERRDRGWDE